MSQRNILLIALGLTISAGPAFAQDSSSSTPPPAGLPSDYTPGSTVTTGTGGQSLLPEGNPLQGLFTPQPQFPTAQTQQNPQPNVPENFGKEGGFGGLFNISGGAAPNPQSGTNNVLQGLFTGQNPFQTPQATQNPQPQAQFATPGYGQAKFSDLEKAGIQFKVGPNTDPNDYEGRVPDPKPATPEPAAAAKKDVPAATKDAKDAKGDKDKDKDKDKAAKDKDGKSDADKDGKDKDKDAKADADKDAKDKDKDKEALKPAGPYNPLKDAISLMQGGKTEQALYVLAEVLKKNPANAEAHYLAGIGWVNLRNYKMAADEYRVVLRLVPATQLAALAIEGLKKIGEPAITKDTPPTKLPPLRQNPR